MTPDEKSVEKDYLKSLSRDERVLYLDKTRKIAKKEWDMMNTDKVFKYRRSTTLRRCEQRCSVPTKQTIEKYNFTKDELKPIFDRLWSKLSLMSDTEDNSSADSE